MSEHGDYVKYRVSPSQVLAAQTQVIADLKLGITTTDERVLLASKGTPGESTKVRFHGVDYLVDASYPRTDATS